MRTRGHTIMFDQIWLSSHPEASWPLFSSTVEWSSSWEMGDYVPDASSNPATMARRASVADQAMPEADGAVIASNSKPQGLRTLSSRPTSHHHRESSHLEIRIPDSAPLARSLTLRGSAQSLRSQTAPKRSEAKASVFRSSVLISSRPNQCGLDACVQRWERNCSSCLIET